MFNCLAITPPARCRSTPFPVNGSTRGTTRRQYPVALCSKQPAPNDVITLNIVQGDWNLIGDAGQVLAIENCKRS